MLIKAIQPLSLLDYPGKLSTIFFLYGCNFNCPYCHNPELVSPKLRDARRTIPLHEAMAFLEKRKHLLDGVVVTGGEPCLNPDLPELLSEIKKRGFLVKLDSNGSMPEMLELLVEKKLVDYIAMDVKAPLEKYGEVTRIKINTEKIKQSIDFIKKSGLPHEFRTTVVPSLLNEGDLIKIGELIQGADAYYLQQFRSDVTLDPDYANKEAYAMKFFNKMKEKLSPYAKKIGVRGLLQEN
ncbi:MAG: anaerobic ribonucleoside-triphosphate reductase activating protein [Candidatus Micrarchaeota archaeon]